MPTVDPVTFPGSPVATATPAAERKSTLDAEVFMKLLVTQLSNQDPSSPMNTNEMIAQTTQLASMEQLTALATTSSETFALSMRNTAASLIGREAQYIDADGATRSGVVTSVSFTGSVPLVHLGTTAVRLDAISGLSLLS